MAVNGATSNQYCSFIFLSLTNCFCHMFVASPPACVIISHSVLFFSSRFMTDQKLKFRQGKNLERMTKILGRRLTDIVG